MSERRILVVDDEAAIRSTLSGVLEDEGYVCGVAESGEECLRILETEPYALVLLDIWLPGMDGLETLVEIQKLPASKRPLVLMISGHGTIESAVRATKFGAFDFLEKPLTLEKVMVAVKNALEMRRLERENRQLRDEEQSRYTIIGESIPMKAVRQQLRLMAATNGRVLIYGESGVGKELVARSLHALSERVGKPFVELNCAAIPEDMIESELFGERNRGLPPPHDMKAGKFERAHGGTLFLDEVGDMSLRTQAKVLRVLDEQRIEPLGASEAVEVDVRVIASTNKDLEKEIERGNFREDLFYRLNVIPFVMPPLRERKEDIPALCGFFLNEFTLAYGRKPKKLTPEALETLANQAWPGNVRELRNMMERIAILHPHSEVEARHLPLDKGRRSDPHADRFVGSLQEVRTSVEREYILKKLEETSGNVSRTAELLGLERSNLYRKMRSLGIAPKEG
ncbi:MAG: sigma-54-dependent Fis family transcriptional regulator [Bryobacterales bacterium]|nr:sigma-54-dependent Fis family transcriptional regulator [Bryobacterales bacterium]